MHKTHLHRILRLLSLVGVFASGLYASADNDALLARLDSTLAQENAIMAEKLNRINMLKKMAAHEKNTNLLLEKYRELSEEYYVLQYDSAVKYADKGLALAEKTGNRHFLTANIIMKASLHAIGGLYSEAINCLNRIAADSLTEEEKFGYNIAYSTVYHYWADYCNDNTFTPIYREKAQQYLKAAVAYLDKDDEAYDYYMGEYYIYVERNDNKALSHYFKTMEKNDETSRFYAMASFSIANNYSAHGDMERYEEYLIKACISDIVCCTKENLALQDLAMFIFKEEDNGNLERARRYINSAMDDAKYYNNRLRIIEISQKLPLIVATYHSMVEAQNRFLRYAVWSISLLGAVLLVFLYFFVRQNRQLSARRHELDQSNSLLTEANGRLNVVNEQLMDTNRKREGLAKLYIDLCAKNIDRMEKFQMTVQRKIKANQTKELLTVISSSKANQQEATAFLKRFDEAFLNLYPSFVTEFNMLLKDGEQVVVNKPGTLSTELRIFALVRLGVKESSEIAALLFYSPRTIYNYRSAFKNKAKDRNTFEDEVRRLCTLYGNPNAKGEGGITPPRRMIA